MSDLLKSVTCHCVLLCSQPGFVRIRDVYDSVGIKHLTVTVSLPAILQRSQIRTEHAGYFIAAPQRSFRGLANGIPN